MSESLPKVVAVPRIAKFMHKLGKLDHGEFVDALRPGRPPTLVSATIFPL